MPSPLASRDGSEDRLLNGHPAACRYEFLAASRSLNFTGDVAGAWLHFDKERLPLKEVNSIVL